MKCANPKCRHRIERHEILSSGKVFCQDCECRDYVVTQLIKDSAFCIDRNFWDEFEAARAAAHISMDFTPEDLGIKGHGAQIEALADEVDSRFREGINFIEGEQWDEFPDFGRPDEEIS